MSVEPDIIDRSLQEDLNKELRGFKKWLKANRWRLFLWLALCAASTVLYVYNVFAVNNLLRDIHVYSKEYEMLRNSNDLLISRAVSLQSAERIMHIAETNLGMVKADRAPEIIK